MRFIAALLLSALPAVASAQVTGVVSDVKIGATEETRNLTANNCGDTLPFTFTLPTVIQACSDFKVWATSTTSCGTDPASGDKLLFSEAVTPGTTPLKGAFTALVTDLPGIAGDGGACGASEIQATFTICSSLQYTSTFNGCLAQNNPVAKDPQPPKVVFDSKPPAVPELTNPLGHDGSVSVDTTFDADTASIVATATPADGSKVVSKTFAKATRLNIDGLTNGVTYTITAHAVDEAGNASAESSAVEATPFLTGGFFQRYVDAGGDTGGCSAAGAGSLGSLALLFGAALILRRRVAR